MKRALLYFVLVVSVVFTSAPCFADLIVNGSFEDPELTGPGSATGAVGNFTLFTSTDFVPGWTLTSGNVDVFHTFGSGSDQSADLNGSVAGTIEQTIATDTGVQYLLDFDLNGAGAAGSIKEVRVSVLRSNDSVVASQVFQFTAQPILTEAGFVNHSLGFVADEASSTIQFESLHTSGFNGPIIDNVRAFAVPEPSSFSSTCLIAITSYLGHRRRRFRPSQSS